MAITVTSKYKPFTYEELVRPLEGYWEKYDAQEAELQDDINNLAQLKAIVDTAPENNIDRLNFDKLYNDFQRSVNALSEEGLSTNNKQLFRDLKQAYNAQVPRILMAAEEAQKAKQEFMKLQNSGKYITPNSNNPGSFTWANYLDGNIPTYDPAISKQEIFADALKQAEAVTKRVTHDPQVREEAMPGYSSITQRQGLKFDSVDEMMQNPIMQNTYNAIRQSYNTDGWDEASINELDKEIKTGMLKGMYYDEKTSYHKKINNNNARSNNPNNSSANTLIGDVAKKVSKKNLESWINDGEPQQTKTGYSIGMNEMGGMTLTSPKSGRSINVGEYDQDKINEADHRLQVIDRLALGAVSVAQGYNPFGESFGKFNKAGYTINATNVLDNLKLSQDQNLGHGSHLTRLVDWNPQKIYNTMKERTQDSIDANTWKDVLDTDFSQNDFLFFMVGKEGSDLAYVAVPIQGIIQDRWDSSNHTFEDFMNKMQPLLTEINRKSSTTYNYTTESENINQRILGVFESDLPNFYTQVVTDAKKQLGKSYNEQELQKQMEISFHNRASKILESIGKTPVSLHEEMNNLLAEVAASMGINYAQDKTSWYQSNQQSADAIKQGNDTTSNTAELMASQTGDR